MHTATLYLDSIRRVCVELSEGKKKKREKEKMKMYGRLKGGVSNGVMGWKARGGRC